MLKALRPYSLLIVATALLSFVANGLSLYLPKKIGQYVDQYQVGVFNASSALWILFGLSFVYLILTLIQSALSTYASEKIGLDMRNKIVGALKGRSFGYMRKATSGHLVTILTSDVDAIKNMIANGVPSMLMAVVTLLGVIYFLLTINLKLGLLTLVVVPFIVLVFGLIFRKIGPLFGEVQMNIDNINKTINETIIASSLVRVLDSQNVEVKKFDTVNRRGTELGQKLVRYFAALIPAVTILSQIAVLVVLWFGGVEVVKGRLTIGEMSAFFAYTSVLIWPFFILSFSGTLISRANVSLKRIYEVLDAEGAPTEITGKNSKDLEGHIVFKNVGLKYGEKEILKNISFEIKPRTRTAIIGPTGAGKTELFYLIAGLAQPTSGEIIIDSIPLNEWNHSALLSKLGMVFQDSVVFNTSFRENVLFKSGATEDALQTALEVADLKNLVEQWPQGLNTDVSERGTTLSGGQKQRLTLARALAIEPNVLLLDDFTARVDAGTEERILQKICEHFGHITLVSITQKIDPIKEYDHIIVLMEGELIAQGRHDDLLKNSIEYQQIYESQQSTEAHQ